MLRRTFLMGAAAAAVLMTAGSVAPSKAARRIGVIVNVTVAGNTGPVRIYAHSSFWNNTPSGACSVQAVGSPLFFQGAPRHLSFSAPNQAHLQADGLYNRRPARLIMDISSDPGNVAFSILQDGNVVLSSLTDAQNRPGLLWGSVQVFAP